jgi:hypothetical protein
MAITRFRFEAEVKERTEELRGQSRDERRRMIFQWVRSGAINAQLFDALLDCELLNERNEHAAA